MLRRPGSDREMADILALVLYHNEEVVLKTPQALTLAREPKANVELYDGLRVRIVGGRHAP